MGQRKSLRLNRLSPDHDESSRPRRSCVIEKTTRFSENLKLKANTQITAKKKLISDINRRVNNSNSTNSYSFRSLPRKTYNESQHDTDYFSENKEKLRKKVDKKVNKAKKASRMVKFDEDSDSDDLKDEEENLFKVKKPAQTKYQTRSFTLNLPSNNNYLEDISEELEESVNNEEILDVSDKAEQPSRRYPTRSTATKTYADLDEDELYNEIEDDLFEKPLKRFGKKKINNSKEFGASSEDEDKAEEKEERRYPVRTRRSTVDRLYAKELNQVQRGINPNKLFHKKTNRDSASWYSDASARQLSHRYETRRRRVSFKHFFSNSINKTHSYSKSYRSSRPVVNTYNFRTRNKQSLALLKLYSSKKFTVDNKPSKYDPLNVKKSDHEDENKEAKGHKPRSKAFNHLPLNIAEVASSRPHLNIPENLIPNDAVSFTQTLSDVGGLKSQISLIKQNILMPSIYPHLCKDFNISPSRGIIFHGPPGTGKTLTARALVAECSQIDDPIAYFQYNSNDILSKWVGKSEQKIREIFDIALIWAPSVVFIDEIDGLTPARCSTDRHSASLVASLLSAMDGLDKRGRVLIIGATNRVQSIDPALRRAGRFEEELHFPLPNLDARYFILENTTKLWPNPPSSALLKTLAEKSNGFCGADLVSLCSHASKEALCRIYPEIHSRDVITYFDPTTINVTFEDFMLAFHRITPSVRLEINMEPTPYATPCDTFFKYRMENMIYTLTRTGPKLQGSASLNQPHIGLVSGNCSLGVYHTLCAILHSLDDIHIVDINLASFTSSDEGSDLKAFQLLLKNAYTEDKKVIILIKNADILLKASNSEILFELHNMLNEPVSLGSVSYLISCNHISFEVKYLLKGLDVVHIDVSRPNLCELGTLIQKYPKTTEEYQPFIRDLLTNDNSLINNEVENPLCSPPFEFDSFIDETDEIRAQSFFNFTTFEDGMLDEGINNVVNYLPQDKDQVLKTETYLHLDYSQDDKKSTPIALKNSDSSNLSLEELLFPADEKPQPNREVYVSGITTNYEWEY